MLLTRWQSTALAVPTRAGWVAVYARRVRVVKFGVRQHGCRSSRTHDPARVKPLPPLVTGLRDWIVTMSRSGMR